MLKDNLKTLRKNKGLSQEELSIKLHVVRQTVSKWGEVFSDNTLANAILDRLLHHSSIIKITGPSYRLKGKIEEMESRVKNS